ncbi:hypothetical protein [Ornithinimicrobium murale]|nr:hypothetical protein [Ornithinimicrobium murale]
MYPDARLVLECQDCGDVVRKLTAGEAQQVAASPHNFVVFCNQCRRERHV